MSLENVLKALELSINSRIDELDEKLLEERNVQETLTTFFAEQQTRPELVSQIRAHSLMYEYLDLSLDEREELEGFRYDYTNYLNGNGLGLNLLSVNSENVRQLIRAQRYVNQILTLFDFYLENREENEVFNANYLGRNKKLKERFGNLGRNLYRNVRNNLKEEGDLDKIIELASEINPKIKKYTTFGEVLKIDGTKQLLRIFDFYLENREENEVFNTNYLGGNKKLKERFGNLGQNLCQNVSHNLKEEGGINYIVQLATQQRSEILQHWQYQERKSRISR